MRLVPAFVLLLAAPLQAEWNLSTLTEGQVGNLPGAQPSDLRDDLPPVQSRLCSRRFPNRGSRRDFWH